MDFKHILKVFIIMFLILSLIVFINSIGLNLKDDSKPKKLLQVVTVEGLSTYISMNPSQAFCEVQKGSLDESCGKLTRRNCNDTSCCVWTSNEKCAAGGVDGPTFNTDTNGLTKQLDYYYFQGKCYGNGCPKVAEL